VAQRPQRQGRPTSEAVVGGVGSIWRLCDGFRGEGRLASIGTGDKASGCQGQVLTLRWGRGGHIDTGHQTRCKLHIKEIQVYNSLTVYIYIYYIVHLGNRRRVMNSYISSTSLGREFSRPVASYSTTTRGCGQIKSQSLQDVDFSLSYCKT
jgi:hypothetical protein